MCYEIVTTWRGRCKDLHPLEQTTPKGKTPDKLHSTSETGRFIADLSQCFMFADRKVRTRIVSSYQPHGIFPSHPDILPEVGEWFSFSRIRLASKKQTVVAWFGDKSWTWTSPVCCPAFGSSFSELCLYKVGVLCDLSVTLCEQQVLITDIYTIWKYL